ncbi:adenosylcobinamide-phosphate synthase CbiB [Pararhodobacter aggregans]|uniref:Cobalamin biosynthesis protein CobD n=1 Tax=Pararhodobacter aggregans TaxID=404875 RepID=A0A2T7UQH1_9RHOB|nr:adenosylcobinamide-phosphate synthase CbiB [Pararhodobacter aggregans]PTX01648.1 adenosylcobinamide-phosphate synthase [Pararhodobacter aggregans]PVE46906.1 cobalamin biosynthesis protein CobD [Pararhodobacter aggregans]
MSFAASMLIAMAIDAVIGWPDALYRRIGHPVTWIGALISGLEARLNQGGARRAKGVLTALVVIGLTGGLAALVLALLPGGWVGTLIAGVLAWPLVAIRSMHQHVAAVVRPLAAGDLEGARYAVSMIVGRDPSTLDEAGVARAAVESLAENTSDGIVAPLFWGAVAGLPGIAAYKAINTLDSMIGHRNERYELFGWASARIDDLVNLAPARLTGALFALCSPRPGAAFRTMAKDARHHRSPNAGWPEAAMAGALGIRLSGPRVYGDRVAQEPWVNAGAPDPEPQDLARGLGLYRRSMLVLALPLAILAVFGW